MADSVEQRTDVEDWQAFHALDRLADHWWWRPGWRPDRHYLTWFLLFDDPALRAHVARFQHALSDLDYLDPVPPDGLHMTVQGIAFADEITADQTAAIATHAQALCGDLAPFEITIGPINGYPGGAFLRATPWQPVYQLRDRLRSAIAAVLGPDRVPTGAGTFKPHISVTYCHADPPAADLIQLVDQLRSIEPTSTTVDAAHLLEQRREHRTYRWDVRHTVHLTTSPQARRD